MREPRLEIRTLLIDNSFLGICGNLKALDTLAPDLIVKYKRRLAQVFQVMANRDLKLSYSLVHTAATVG